MTGKIYFMQWSLAGNSSIPNGKVTEYAAIMLLSSYSVLLVLLLLMFIIVTLPNLHMVNTFILKLWGYYLLYTYHLMHFILPKHYYHYMIN